MEQVFKSNLENDRKEIASLMGQYVSIILQEYKEKIPTKIRERLESITDFDPFVRIEDTKTITLYATMEDSVIHLPLDAYTTMQTLKTIPEYGMDKNHKTHDASNMIKNDNTFRTFVEHIILKGMTPVAYFKEILLHETMHICGSPGSSGLAEGFNELKTRELALKYGLETSCCGYPKETKLAFALQEIFGKEIGDKIAFSDFIPRLNILRDELGEEALQLYVNVYNSVEKQFRPYMDKKYPGVKGINDKCLSYDAVDYTDAYSYINQYKVSKEKGGKKN